jgi:DNA-binding winged helix-turn-helix (wHTH) protein
VLRYLVEHPGRLVTPDELLEALWPDTYVNPEGLRRYIQEIRKVLGDRPGKPEFIKTMPRPVLVLVVAINSPSSPPALERAGLEAPWNERQLRGQCSAS